MTEQSKEMLSVIAHRVKMSGYDLKCGREREWKEEKPPQTRPSVGSLDPLLETVQSTSASSFASCLLHLECRMDLSKFLYCRNVKFVAVAGPRNFSLLLLTPNTV